MVSDSSRYRESARHRVPRRRDPAPVPLSAPYDVTRLAGRALGTLVGRLEEAVQEAREALTGEEGVMPKNRAPTLPQVPRSRLGPYRRLGRDGAKIPLD